MNVGLCGDEFASPTDLAQVRSELYALYQELDEAVAELGPVCEISGRCCRFQDYGHTLFLSAPEALLLVSDAPPPARALDAGQTCPWQDMRGRCSAREARPLGCRVYFCDPAFQSHAPELSERFIARLKRTAQEHAWLWNYAPLHHHLQHACSEGLLKFPNTRNHNGPQENIRTPEADPGPVDLGDDGTTNTEERSCQ
jgi:hypothetical protein